jgi:hypothetical protein
MNRVLNRELAAVDVPPVALAGRQPNDLTERLCVPQKGP